LFAGSADTHPYLTKLKQKAEKIKVTQQIEWLGFISEAEKLSYYAKATAVVYTPFDEDYGYVSLEAMLSQKPVLTCTDSGGTNEFVNHGETGYISPPDARQLAKFMDKLWLDRKQSKKMGQAGRKKFLSMNINWDSVVNELLS